MVSGGGIIEQQEVYQTLNKLYKLTIESIWRLILELCVRESFYFMNLYLLIPPVLIRIMILLVKCGPLFMPMFSLILHNDILKIL